MRLAIVLIHYHTPHLAAEAVAALLADLAGSGLAAEIVLVDNGSDRAAREILAGLPVVRLDPGKNLGYAGGVNFGFAHTTADIVVPMNTDVFVRPGCLKALLAVLATGAEVVGPRFFWDRGCTLLLPPAELRSRRGELLTLLAGHRERWAARARRRWRRHARAHWEAVAPLPSFALSGCLLAIRRSTWERIGPFDAGYPLYFEETDWLRRAERRRVAAFHVPAAEAVHLYNQAAAREPRAEEWFSVSTERFRNRHYGVWFSGLLHRVERRLSRLPTSEGRASLPFPPAGLDLATLGRPFPLWVELSPNPSGFPAASQRIDAPDGPWYPPASIAAELPPGGLALRVVDRAGAEVASFLLSVAGRGGS